MRIGILTQWYDPETGPAALPAVYAREFVKQGHQVNVLTGFPNYPEGRLYPGYSIRPRTREGEPPLGVTRVALYPNHSKSALGRLANYASFGLSATFLGGDTLRTADMIWVYNSPITVTAPMLAHSRLGRIPIFLHVQDLWPDSLIESGMLPPRFAGHQLARAMAALVRLTERRSAVVGVISKSVRELILERNPGIDPARVVYVPNPTNEQLFRPVSEIRLETGIDKTAGDVVEVMYAGAIGEVQGLDTLVEAARRLRHRPDVRFTLVGDGISRGRLQAKVVELELDNVKFMGRVPQETVPHLLARADIQLVSLASNPFLAHTTPSKIPSLLASEVPIIAQLEGDGARLLGESGAAVVVPPGDAQALAQAIESVADAGSAKRAEMGCSGRRFYEEHLSVEAAATKITGAIRGAASSGERTKTQVQHHDDEAMED